MKELDINARMRLELSQKTTALYPEFTDGWQNITLERMIMFRASAAGKDISVGQYGSPNHGEQKWTFGGASKFYMVTEGENGEQDIKEDRVVIIDGLIRDLKGGSIALFSEYDVINAQKISALPKVFMDNMAQLMDLVANDKRNGIIVIPKIVK